MNNTDRNTHFALTKDPNDADVIALYDFVLQNKELIEHIYSLNNGMEFLVFDGVKVTEEIETLDDNDTKTKCLNCLDKFQVKGYTCPCCGTHTNVFLQDYRDVGGCISKYISCTICRDTSNEDYFKMMKSDNPYEIINDLFKEESND